MIHHRKRLHVNLKHNKITYLALTYILISLIQIYILTYFFDLGFKINLIIVSGSVFVLSLILFLSYLIYSSSSKEDKLEKKQLELHQLASYTDNLEIIYNDMRKMRHDYMNVLASMIGYMKDRDLDALIEYYNNHVMKFTDKMKEADLRLGRLSYVKQSELKGLIALKVIQAQERNIQVNVDVVEDISFTGMDMIDLCRVVGILLDNAIEGADETEEPLVELGLINKVNSRLIVITNTCKKPEVSIYTLYKQGFSTKGEDRGLGLSNLKEIISKYPNISQETIIKEGMFKQFVEFIF
jgi:two-component system sensor histidine kinase AgrC